jgi:hypothetical protein
MFQLIRTRAYLVSRTSNHLLWESLINNRKCSAQLTHQSPTHRQARKLRPSSNTKVIANESSHLQAQPGSMHPLSHPRRRNYLPGITSELSLLPRKRKCLAALFRSHQWRRTTTTTWRAPRSIGTLTPRGREGLYLMILGMWQWCLVGKLVQPQIRCLSNIGSSRMIGLDDLPDTIGS